MNIVLPNLSVGPIVLVVGIVVISCSGNFGTCPSTPRRPRAAWVNCRHRFGSVLSGSSVCSSEW